MYYNLYIAPFNNYPHDGLYWTSFRTLKEAKEAGRATNDYKKTVRMFNDPYDECVMAEFKFITARDCGILTYK